MNIVVRMALLAGMLLQFTAVPIAAQGSSFIYGTLSANPARMANKAKEAGFSHVWIYVPWRNVEPSKGRFLFKEKDEWGQTRANDLTNAIQAAKQNGLKLVLRLDEPPAWAGGTFHNVKPDDVKNYLREAVRYGADTIDIVEVGNEWNLSAPWAWGATPDPARAAALVKAGAAGAREGKPGVKVVTPAVAPRPLEPYGDTHFLEFMLQHLSSSDYDFVGMHPYIGSLPPEQDPATCTPMCFRLVEEWYEAAKRVHGSGVKAFITEVGTLEQSSADLGGYEWMELPADRRAEYLVRALQYARSHYPWLAGAMVFNLDYATVNTQPLEQRSFSLLEADGTPRKAWYAFRDALRSGALAAPAAPAAPTIDYSPLIRDAFGVAFGREPGRDEIAHWTSVLSANPSLASMSGMLGQLENVIRGDRWTRDDLFNRAWQDVWGAHPGTIPSAWDQLIAEKGLWYVTVLRALRIERSYVDVFGRNPTNDELSYWMGLSHDDPRVQSFNALVDNHLHYLAGDVGARADLIRRSYVAVFGREPEQGELDFWLGQPVQTFPALVENHKQFLAGQWPGIINDAYWLVFGRLPSPDESGYWQSQPPRTLAAMMQDHLNYMAANSGAWAGVIRDSYLAVFGREPSAGELDFWLSQHPQIFWVMLERHNQYLAEQWPGVINDAYWLVFGRLPTDGERGYWLAQAPRALQTLVKEHMDYLAGDPGARAGIIHDSYLATFGREPEQGELDFWLGQPAQTFWAMVDNHNQYLADAWPSVIDDSYAAVFGRAPSADERGYWLSQPPRTLQAMLKIHMDYLASDRAARENLISDSYWAVFGRPATDGEFDFWLSQPPQTLHSLIAAHWEWLASNPVDAPDSTGEMLAGDGSPVVVPSSPGLLASVSGGSMVVAGAGNLIGLDGATIVAAGGGNLIGLDGATMVAAGAGNLIGLDGGTMVAAGAGNLIGLDGATMVAAGAGNLIGQDGATMVAAGAGNMVAAGGLNMVAAGAGNLIGNNGNTLVPGR